MNYWLSIGLLWTLAASVQADGFNDRGHPNPGAQAKINRVIAQAYSMNQAPVDHTVIYSGIHPPIGHGLNLGLSIGTVNASPSGQAPREVNVVTRDNMVICLHCGR